MALTMTVSKQAVASVKFLDKKGNPAPVDGPPTWTTDNSDVLALTPAADGLSCLIVAVGQIGTGNVQVSADADLGAGVTPIIGTLACTITGGTATTVTIDVGAPTEQS